MFGLLSQRNGFFQSNLPFFLNSNWLETAAFFEVPTFVIFNWEKSWPIPLNVSAFSSTGIAEPVSEAPESCDGTSTNLKNIPSWNLQHRKKKNNSFSSLTLDWQLCVCGCSLALQPPFFDDQWFLRLVFELEWYDFVILHRKSCNEKMNEQSYNPLAVWIGLPPIRWCRMFLKISAPQPFSVSDRPVRRSLDSRTIGPHLARLRGSCLATELENDNHGLYSQVQQNWMTQSLVLHWKLLTFNRPADIDFVNLFFEIFWKHG